MKQLLSVSLMAGIVALAAISLPATLLSQTQPTFPAFEAAALVLPDAPQPQTATPPASPASSSSQPADAAKTKEQLHEEAERELKAEEKQRLLGVMPQFNVVMNGHAVPLTKGEKMRLALHSARDPYYIGYAVLIGGGYSELVDSHSGFGWGPAGFFKRVGASYADNVDGAVIGNGILPVLLHQDPRYFRLGTGSFGHRFVHAALSTVVCRGDNGKNQFNYSNVLGNYISGAISNAYYPANERGLGLTFENGTEVTLFGAVGGQLYEFAPDIVRHLHKKKPAATTPATPQTPNQP